MTKHIVAIDPDVTKSGVAYLEPDTRRMECSSLTFAQLMNYLQFVKRKETERGEPAVVVVEAGWLNTAHWHLNRHDSARTAAAKGNAAGRNHETGRKIVEMARHMGLEVVEQPPLRKVWQGPGRKITHRELAAFTGLTGRTSQDMRDAALLAWVYAGLPIRVNSENLKAKKGTGTP